MMHTRCFSADLKNLAEIRKFVEDTSAIFGIDPEDTMDLVQAVDEAATNIMVHGYQDHSGEIEVEIKRQENLLIVSLRDTAPIFDPTLAPSPNLRLPLEERQVGGLGIYLIRQSVDEFHHRAIPTGGNELILVKYATLNKT